MLINSPMPTTSGPFPAPSFHCYVKLSLQDPSERPASRMLHVLSHSQSQIESYPEALPDGRPSCERTHVRFSAHTHTLAPGRKTIVRIGIYVM